MLALGLAAALVWVNIDAGSYERVWRTVLSIRVGDAGIALDLRHWVNDGLMTFFFFVIGLEARREFDMVAAWSVDRLGRSLQDLVGFLSDLQAKRVDLYLHQQALDTTTPAGRMLFQMLGVFAEFERALIVERVNAGLARARAKGTTLGRPRTAPAVEARIRKLAGQGMGKIKIARTLGVGVSVAQRVLA